MTAPETGLLHAVAAEGEPAFLPLAGVRVLDLSKILAGPLCTQYLADLGAEVTKVEPVRGGDDTRHWPPFHDGEGALFVAVNRNKRSLALDLKAPEGLAACRALVARADVVVESFGPGASERLGLGHAALAAIKPDLIHVSISGFGSQGPMREGKGYDLIAQAFTGMLAMTGHPGAPPARSPFSPIDQTTGLHAVVGITSALLRRERTGQGARLEVSLFDSAVGLLGYILQNYWSSGVEPAPPGSSHESLCPYQAFETADGPIVLGVANDALWRAFCGLAARDDLARDARFATTAGRAAHRSVIVPVVADILKTRPRAEWLEALHRAGVPSAPVHTLGELSRHPHLAASGMLLDAPGEGPAFSVVASPLRADGARPALRSLPPRLGQHSREVLREVEMGEAEIDTLVARGVVATA